MSDEKVNFMNMGTLDKQLRAVEASLQQDDTRMDSKITESTDNVGNVGNIDKIRDILFGAYIRDYEKRFKRLEERLNQESTHLRDDMAQRIKALEELLDTELDNLSEKTKIERQERQLSYQDLKNEINGLRNEFNNRFTQFDEQVTKEIKQLRQQAHSRFQELGLQLRQQGDNITLLLKQEVAQLQEEKVGRSDLASFFSEFALRLNKDFSTPNKVD